MRSIPARARVCVPRLLTSAAIAGSVVGAASESEAAVIQYDLNPDILIHDGVTINLAFLDIDIDGTNDFSFEHNYGGRFSLVEDLDGDGPNTVWKDVLFPTYAARFNNQSFNQTTVSAVKADFFRGTIPQNVGNPWLDGADGYLNGLFLSGLDGLTHQFWVRLSVDPTERGALTLKEVAWETDEFQQTPTAVPEPGTLTLLALGAAGAAAIRRRTSR